MTPRTGLERLMVEFDLRPREIITASERPITLKMISKARRGLSLTPRIKWRILHALRKRLKQDKGLTLDIFEARESPGLQKPASMRLYQSAIQARRDAEILAQAWRAIPPGRLQDDVRNLSVEVRSEELRILAQREKPLPVATIRAQAARALGAVLNALAREEYTSAAGTYLDLFDLLSQLVSASKKPAEEAGQ
jgi:hypothetical protein